MRQRISDRTLASVRTAHGERVSVSNPCLLHSIKCAIFVLLTLRFKLKINKKKKTHIMRNPLKGQKVREGNSFISSVRFAFLINFIIYSHMLIVHPVKFSP